MLLHLDNSAHASYSLCIGYELVLLLVKCLHKEIQVAMPEKAWHGLYSGEEQTWEADLIERIKECFGEKNQVLVQSQNLWHCSVMPRYSLKFTQRYTPV